MINHQDSSSFDDYPLHQEMKQTAQFFNPQMSSLGQTIKFQQKQLQRISEQAFKISSNRNKDIQNQQVNEKRSSLIKKQVDIVKSPKQSVQNQILTPIMHKYGSPPKLMNIPSVKPFSPPQPITSTEHVVISKNNSVAQFNEKSGKPMFPQNQIATGNRKNISIVDIQSTHKIQAQKQTIEIGQPEYPSYQQSLLNSRQSQINYDKMQKSNSTFLPKIKQQVQNINTNQQIGYGSIQQFTQQETIQRINISKQTFTNEFLNCNLPEEDISRKSKTAQQIRDSLDQKSHLKFGQKLSNIKYNDQESQVISIQSPKPNNNKQYTLQSIGGSGKPKRVLDGISQKKILLRLYSSKSDNNQVN